jgi:hypothetical protein
MNVGGDHKRPSSLWLHECFASDSIHSEEEEEKVKEGAVLKHLHVPPLVLKRDDSAAMLPILWFRKLEAVLQWASWAFRQG